LIGPYVPQFGYYPLAPLVGFAVLCGYTALAFCMAILLQQLKEETLYKLGESKENLSEK